MAPSRYGRHGFVTRTGFSLFVELARHPVMIPPCCEGKLNLVFVDDVAKDIIKGASGFTGPVQMYKKGRPFHPIYMPTSNSYLTLESMNILIYICFQDIDILFVIMSESWDLIWHYCHRQYHMI